MPVFEYRGFGESGEVQKGVITADTPEEARSVLRDRGLHVKFIKGIAKRKAFTPFKFGAREELTAISRQLATLLGSGTNLSRALSIIIKQTNHPGLRSALMQIRESLNRGVSFGNALEGFPEYFSNLYISMVKAGESSGSLHAVLSRLADYYQKRKKLMSGLVSAMVYPMFVMIIGILVVIYLMIFIVPKLVKLLTRGSGETVLPLPTQVLVGLSSLFVSYWWIFLLGLCILIFAGYYILSRERGRYLFDRLLLRIPVIGPLFRKTAVARFATTFSTLLKSGIPPLDGLLIVQEVLNNRYLEEAISQVRRGVMDGNDMSSELDRTGVFPPIVGHMVSVGEESGELESLLEEIADTYDTEVALATEKFIAVLEPIMIIIMAFIIGFIVFAVILPITEIGSIV